MNGSTETGVEAEADGGGLSGFGAVLIHIGLAAIAVSTVWTTRPLAPHGRFESDTLPFLGLHFERYTLALLGLALLAAAVIGRRRFAAAAPAKLLCALGAAACLRLAVDPTLDRMIPPLEEHSPGHLFACHNPPTS